LYEVAQVTHFRVALWCSAQICATTVQPAQNQCVQPAQRVQPVRDNLVTVFFGLPFLVLTILNAHSDISI
jgi:hypothetical protein